MYHPKNTASLTGNGDLKRHDKGSVQMTSNLGIIIGYTTGVFDMFHVGHLNILRQAREKCDFLIVGVSSDKLVSNYKKKTPVIPLEDRMQIVASIRYVDKVVVQEHRDKVKAQEEVGFNRMFVGDDWKGNPIFQEAETQLNERGVNVVYFPYTQNVSSTQLKKVLEDIEANNRL